jgi:hypothetical protein
MKGKYHFLRYVSQETIKIELLVHIEILFPPLLGNILLFLTQISRYSNVKDFQTSVEKNIVAFYG